MVKFNVIHDNDKKKIKTFNQINLILMMWLKYILTYTMG